MPRRQPVPWPVLAAFGLLVSCASVHAIEELPVRGPTGETGVVYGSFVVLVDDEAGSEPWVDAKNSEFRLEISVGGTEFVEPDIYCVDAASGVETFFAVELPVPHPGGVDYGMRLRRRGWRELEAGLSTRLPVYAGKLSYFGRIVARLPRWIGGPNARLFTVEIQDRMNEGDSWLAAAHPQLHMAATKALCVHWPNFLGGRFTAAHGPPDVPEIP